MPPTSQPPPLESRLGAALRFLCDNHRLSFRECATLAVIVGMMDEALHNDRATIEGLKQVYFSRFTVADVRELTTLKIPPTKTLHGR